MEDVIECIEVVSSFGEVVGTFKTIEDACCYVEGFFRRFYNETEVTIRRKPQPEETSEVSLNG